MKTKKKLKDSNPKPLNFRLPTDLVDKLDKYCKQNGFSRTGWLVSMIENEVAAEVIMTESEFLMKRYREKMK